MCVTNALTRHSLKTDFSSFFFFFFPLPFDDDGGEYVRTVSNLSGDLVGRGSKSSSLFFRTCQVVKRRRFFLPSVGATFFP